MANCSASSAVTFRRPPAWRRRCAGATKATSSRCSARRPKRSAARRLYNFRYRSPAHWIEIFRRFYGPTHKAFAALDADGQSRLHADLMRLLESRNVGGPDSLVVPGEYLETVLVRH
ncbi:hypothetical protein [Aromatoleum sp.]|uniref:hypothetical protein n=1 Tax=Aromatoleum sp. TaxID=2307007 RepID=UPI002FC91AB4